MPTLYDKKIEEMNKSLERWGKPIANTGIISAYLGVFLLVFLCIWWLF
jgi:hypothetical protein